MAALIYLQESRLPEPNYDKALTIFRKLEQQSRLESADEFIQEMERNGNASDRANGLPALRQVLEIGSKMAWVEESGAARFKALKQRIQRLLDTHNG